MFLTQTAHLLYDALLTVAYPRPCAICYRSVEHQRLGSVCLECWAATRIFAVDDAICVKCGCPTRKASHQIDPEMVNCRRCDFQLFQAARACGPYDGGLRASALALKREPFVSLQLRQLLVDIARRSPLTLATRLMPVPLHPERERQRGFNQAALLAREISPSLGLVVDEVSLIRVNASQKYRAGLDKKGRRETVDKAFRVQFPQLIAGETILLVDDVFTTGATASSCAAALLEAGAKSVFVLTIARPSW